MVCQFTLGPPGCQLSIAGPGGWYSAYGGRYALQGGTREAHQSPSNQNAPTPLTPSAQRARGNPPAQLDRATVHVDTAALLSRPRGQSNGLSHVGSRYQGQRGRVGVHGTIPTVEEPQPPRIPSTSSSGLERKDLEWALYTRKKAEEGGNCGANNQGIKCGQERKILNKIRQQKQNRATYWEAQERAGLIQYGLGPRDGVTPRANMNMPADRHVHIGPLRGALRCLRSTVKIRSSRNLWSRREGSAALSQ